MHLRNFLSIVFVLLVLSCILVAGCTTSPVSGLSTDSPGSRGVQSIVDANNQFSFDLYKKLKDDPENPGKNLFFSPLSLSFAMAITYEGADKKTAEEIRSVFHFPENRAAMREDYSGLSATVESGNDNAVSLQLANALWAEKTYPFLPEYTTTARDYYGAKTTNLDFRNDPDNAVVVINQWAGEKTGGKIQDLVSRQVIDPGSTCLVITNAISFIGTWERQFSEGDTFWSTFYVSPDTSVQVEMMRRAHDAKFRYGELSDSTQVIELPYEKSGGHQLSMIILLPKNSSLESVENSLDAGELDRIRQSLETRDLEVLIIPKFSLDTQYRLSDILGSMGMPAAFSPDADFSRMSGNSRGLFIDFIIHKAHIDVNEAGTLAAAATAHGVSQGISDKPYFIANRPFLFIIQDRENGNILFMGRVMNPNGS
jgi:serpin B